MVAVIEMDWQDILDGKPFPESPARQLFTNTVISVAAQAKAAMPEANGRVDRARDLVLGGLVSRNADGTFTVCSQSERGKTYVINGSCPCPDAQKRQSQCAHLIATWIWRKARKAIEEQFASDATEQQSAEMPKATTPVASSLPEAPASCNVYVSIGGRNVQVTLRDTDEQHMLARLEALLQRFPVVEEPKEPAQQEGWCYQHNVQMKLNHGKRGSWWSHKLPNGQWCNQK